MAGLAGAADHVGRWGRQEARRRPALEDLQTAQRMADTVDAVRAD
jgi:hypothetical protein